MFAASGASAQAIGWYGAIDGGVHFPQDIKAASPAVSGAWKLKDSWIVDGRLGYQFTPNWRLEGEFAYRDGGLKSITLPSGALVSPSGSVNVYSYMANVLYDFAPASKVNPFLGVGAGARQANFKTSGTFATVPAGYSNPETFASNDADTKFAWQVLAGLAFKVSDRLNVDLTYRYQDGDKFKWLTSTSGAAPTVQLGAFSGSVQDHSVTVGLRYSFAAPPAPPPPPPPPPPPAAASSSAPAASPASAPAASAAGG
ncbi:MAG: outer membrane protein [Caulobacteraceae bacterium]